MASPEGARYRVCGAPSGLLRKNEGPPGTQAAGLGSVSSPLWGWGFEVASSVALRKQVKHAPRKLSC